MADNRRILVLILAAFLALVAGLFYFGSARDADQFAQCRASRIAGGTAQVGGPFELLNERGETVTDADVLTGPSLIYFGYTFCPDVCPLDNARNAEAVTLLEERGLNVTPVFISIDPERDTPEVVGEFADLFHERMVGLTGSPEQSAAASKAYRTYYKREETDDEYYLVDHSTSTYFYLPEHGVVEFFGRDDTPEGMADRVQCYIEAQ